MRIVFRSDDRLRGQTCASPAYPRAAAPTHEEGPGQPVARRRVLELRERHDVNGTLRLTLLGDLDLTVAETLSTRLQELKAAGEPVRLDLSQLAFIDSSGLQALLLALADARSTGWQLEVASEVSSTVERAAQIMGTAQLLWPEGRPAPYPDAARSGTPHELA
jgi:anti-anti-sigma factor